MVGSTYFCGRNGRKPGSFEPGFGRFCDSLRASVCRFTITSQWCSLVILAALFVSQPATAQSDAPLHYYDAAIGKTGTALKSTLQSIIRNHTVIPYTSSGIDTWAGVKILDQDSIVSSNVVLIYSGISVPKSEQFNGSSGTWDREHLWPQSFGLIALSGSSKAKSDLFNLRPINTGVNSSRGNKYYDVSTPPVSTYAGAPGSTYDSDSWEPRDVDKGPIARSMFYMAVRYDGSDADVPDLELSDTPNPALYRFGKLTTLLAWHRQFFVALPERQRNQRVYSDYQNNRNPFIDHPEYAEMVFYGVSPGLAWRDTHFSAAQLADPLVGGDSADPDADGLSNLLEYALNGDPWQPEPAPTMTVSVTMQSGSRYLLLSFPHNRNATDVMLTYEGSGDLHTWMPASWEPVSVVVTSSETERVTVRFPSSASGYFVRVRATRIVP